jgi:hypothetical protein
LDRGRQGAGIVLAPITQEDTTVDITLFTEQDEAENASELWVIGSVFRAYLNVRQVGGTKHECMWAAFGAALEERCSTVEADQLARRAAQTYS